ncbi:MAG: formate dehydrogenase accessory protein FdhE [Deltaproteobacteria bacterium]|nr:MAG: formate dehydrogenase accessory protein FdhE [Deltaproteobacteria bacterium]
MGADLNDLYQRVGDRLNLLRQKRIEHEEILAFYAKVLAAQQEAQRETKVPDVHLREDHLTVKVEEGFPLVDRESFPVDENCTLGLFQTICRLAMEENPVLAGAGETLLEAAVSGALDISQLITATLNNDSTVFEVRANDLGINLPILQALTKLSLQPSLFAAAEAMAQRVALSDWRHGYCPICGALPAIAGLVGEEGKRTALCSFCGHSWQLPRLSCPFCDNTEQEQLRYFYGEGDDLYRVQVCDQCGSYLKVVDTREGGDVEVLAVDDVATAHLDLLAEQAGYQRRAPRLWGI